jgi:hypothetical protein
MRSDACALFSILAAAALACGQPTPASGDRRADPNACATCHMSEYTSAKNPVHVGVKPTTCSVCHAQVSWHPSRVDHSWWALDGAHDGVECARCHRGEPVVFRGTTKDCVGCHRAEFDQANVTLPWHARFATTCQDCHTTTAWKPSTAHEEPEPEPVVSAVPSASASAEPAVSASASARPVVIRRPPRPHPTGTATTAPTVTPTTTPTKPPDVVIGGSRRRRGN